MNRYLPHAEVYHAVDGWRWRVRAANGRILADSGQAYSRRQSCLDGLAAVTGSPEHREVER